MYHQGHILEVWGKTYFMIIRVSSRRRKLTRDLARDFFPNLSGTRGLDKFGISTETFRPEFSNLLVLTHYPKSSEITRICAAHDNVVHNIVTLHHDILTQKTS